MLVFASPARLEVEGISSWSGGGELGPEVASFCAGAVRVGVDGPGGPSCGSHLSDTSVAAKFRAGRCSEQPVHGYPPVAWVTPGDAESAPGWMRRSFEVWSALAEAGLDAVETYPAACFHRLCGRRWPPPKTTEAGRAARLEALADAGMKLPADAGQWGHDTVDAAVAALAAAVGVPRHHSCPEPDGSVIWLV